MNLYAAYGSNLNKHQMLKRCPKSEPIGTIVLDKFRLTFKGVADAFNFTYFPADKALSE